jgi:hypothetical protein
MSEQIDLTKVSDQHAQKTRRKKQFRFSEEYDKALLTQVITVFPFSLAHGKKTDGWKKIATSLRASGMDLDHRRCQERTDLLLSSFRKSENESRRKSGVDENYTELDILLTDLVEMLDDLEANNEKKARQMKQDEEAAERIRDAALQDLKKKRRQTLSADEGTENDVESNDVTARRRKKHKASSREEVIKEILDDSNKAMMNHWAEESEIRKEENLMSTKRWAEERELREEELRLRREELAMQRQKLELESEERKNMANVMIALVQALSKNH